ncbi:hypothetical protein PR002_g28466 [Phytophthora rubi]|uniref:Uncharacterized protein n=1 Tax=Phytophthora rubi TaxID=129364 RepID=A0A6A3HAA2_9STRA|nr:hypothetical protein PR002_g28466 [Phytophthora rubi]
MYQNYPWTFSHTFGIRVWNGQTSILSSLPWVWIWVRLTYSFDIRHLVPNQRYTVHGSRLKFYADASLDVDEELLAHVGNQGIVLVVEHIKQHRKENVFPPTHRFARNLRGFLCARMRGQRNGVQRFRQRVVERRGSAVDARSDHKEWEEGKGTKDKRERGP